VDFISSEAGYTADASPVSTTLARLEVKDLQTWFYTRRGTVKAVDGVSFSLEPGETLGLVGESGSGKSITCLSILRLVPEPAGHIVGGEIRLGDTDLLQLSRHEMEQVRGRHVSMVLQDPMTSLNPVFNVEKQVGEGSMYHLGLHGTGLKDRVQQLLRWVRIPAPDVRANDYPHQMSGGMRQRIVGAIALSSQPSVLIADEPTTSLDVTNSGPVPSVAQGPSGGAPLLHDFRNPRLWHSGQSLRPGGSDVRRQNCGDGRHSRVVQHPPASLCQGVNRLATGPGYGGGMAYHHPGTAALPV
jgi:ABC-type dipeptide/oligopeptide/nickel transport system ATPase subunit